MSAELTVALELILTAAAAAAVYYLLRRQRRAFGTLEERATLRTLAFATSTLRALRQGLTARSAEQVLPEVARQAAAPAVAIFDAGGLLAYHAGPGAGERHRRHPGLEQEAVLEGMASGRLRLLAVHEGELSDCGLRSAVVVPLTVLEQPVAALVTYHAQEPSPAALRIASDLAELLATQLRLQEADRARVALARSELRALRAQISPHFVYNTLTTIAAFIRTDPDRARQLITDFADFTRRAFRSPQAEFTTLADELVYVNQYLVIEQARLGERLSVRYKIDPEVLNTIVPALILQPLVENAVKHGIEAQSRSGTVTVLAQDGDDECQITVRDDGQGFEPRPDGAEPAGALTNIDRRLRQVFGADHRLDIESSPGRGTTVRLRVPKYRPGVRAS